MFTRRLGRSGIAVSAMGLGCWAIGGPWTIRGCGQSGWGQVDDHESIRAIRWAVDAGVTLFDTADCYGCGHSERILGEALSGRRQEVIIATKFGYVFNETTREVSGSDFGPDYIRRALVASLRRLNTDFIDLYQFQSYDCTPETAVEVRETLEDLVNEGKIRWYGWSTNDPARARVFAEGEHCTAIQHHFNLLEGNPSIISLCEEFDLASISRGPLSMGLLTGKFNANSTFPADDMRSDWNFRDGEEARLLEQLAQIHPVLTENKRTLAQAALGWLWARSPRIIPIPGFKTQKQVQENVAALQHGSLTIEQMEEISHLLGFK
jgi:aryl-alcohol dehydrogenase-like predicted oxidoreductase